MKIKLWIVVTDDEDGTTINSFITEAAAMEHMWWWLQVEPTDDWEAAYEDRANPDAYLWMDVQEVDLAPPARTDRDKAFLAVAKRMADDIDWVGYPSEDAIVDDVSDGAWVQTWIYINNEELKP